LKGLEARPRNVSRGWRRVVKPDPTAIQNKALAKRLKDPLVDLLTAPACFHVRI
jgi:hypothetical protein